MFYPEFWNDFVSNGVSTLIGAIIGIPIALWLSTFQGAIEQRARKAKILILLEEELSANLELLQQWEHWPEDFMVRSLNLVAYIKVKHWDAFADGGELQWIQNPKLLSEIADAYHQLKMLEELCEKYYIVLPLEGMHASQGSIERIISLVETGVTKAIESVERAIMAIDRIETSLTELNWYERMIRRTGSNRS